MSLLVASPDANDCLVERLDISWVKRVRFGALLLFWTILLAPLLANVAGFSVTLTVGIDYEVYMKWIHLIPTLAGCPLLIGVFAVTTPWPSTATPPAGAWLRRFVRPLAAFQVLHQVAITGSEFTYDITDAVWFALPGYLVAVCGTFVGFSYLIFLSTRFGTHALARSLRATAVGYLLVATLIFVWGYLVRYDELSAWTPWLYAQWATVLAALAIWLWGLVLLRKFAGHLARGLEGRCIACGYSLQGLPEPRCPECGQALQVQPTA
jgi:hypothetical protein